MNVTKAQLFPLAFAALIACDTLVDPLPGPPDFAGIVQELRPGIWRGSAGHTLVVARPDGTAMVHLFRDSQLYRRTADGELEPIDRDALTPGTEVEVWTTGVELRSLPPQYAARQVVAR